MMDTGAILSRVENKDLKYATCVLMDYREVIHHSCRGGLMSRLDLPELHQPRWHQWGIVTHSIFTREFYDCDVPSLLEGEGLARAVEKYMSDSVDDKSKDELFRLMLPLHDIGKFMGWNFEEDEVVSHDYSDHAQVGGELILELPFFAVLRSYDLSADQAGYISKCVANHSILSDARSRLKADGDYSMAAVVDEDFLDEVISGAEQDLLVETGLAFLADSLGKLSYRLTASSDGEIEVSRERVKKGLDEKGLGRLVDAALQQPVNMRFALAYLKKVFGSM